MISGIVTWLLRGWLSRWALTAEGEIKDGWRWLTSSAVHFLSFALVLSLGCNVWLWRGWNAEKAELTTAKQSAAAWEKAAGTMRASYDKLHAALAVQNAAVAAMKTEADKRTAAGAEALRGAQGRIDAMQGAAVHIRAAAPPVGACKTPAEVLAAKGVL